jgi:hypothetical protein
MPICERAKKKSLTGKFDSTQRNSARNPRSTAFRGPIKLLLALFENYALEVTRL